MSHRTCVILLSLLPALGCERLGLATGGGQATPGDAADAAHFTCPMHPAVKQATPGKCPLCGMDLTPAGGNQAANGAIVIDPERRKRIGVTLATVEKRPMQWTIRAAGHVTYDESRLTDVSLRVDGWVETLVVDETGQRVNQGQVLLWLYSPELVTAQAEYLAARAASDRPRAGARQRLRLLGLADSQIDELERTGTPSERVPLLAPVGGYVIEKEVVAGGRVMAGMRLFRLARLDKIWVEAQIFEADLPYVRVGLPATVSLTHTAGAPRQGTVGYVYPYLDEMTRTARARIELPNAGLELLPAMFADVEIRADLGERLAVPESAVLYTGPRRIVFVDAPNDHLVPREVVLGARAGGYFEVKDGLAPGDRVVTSGNFLVAAESRIQSGGADPGGDHGHP